MNNDITNEIKGLNDDDLLALYDDVLAHLQYLKDSVIVEKEEVVDSNNDGGEAKDG